MQQNAVQNAAKRKVKRYKMQGEMPQIARQRWKIAVPTEVMLCLYGINIQAANAKLLHQNMVNSMQNAHFGADKIGEPRSKEKCKVIQNAHKIRKFGQNETTTKAQSGPKRMVLGPDLR